MNKTIKLSLSLIVALTTFSCASYIYYQKVELNKPLKGRFRLVSCQLRKTPIKWSVSVSSGNYTRTTTYSVQFDQPALFLANLLEVLTRENISKLKVTPLDSAIRKKFLRQDSFNYITYHTLDGLIPVYDDKDNHDRMDPVLLDFLNQNYDCDYYVVFDGDIINYEIPMLFNFFEFSLEYEISLVVYDREGKKRLSKHFSKYYKRIPDSHKNGDLYYELLKRTVTLYEAELNKALDMLISTEKNATEPLDKLVWLD